MPTDTGNHPSITFEGERRHFLIFLLLLTGVILGIAVPTVLSGKPLTYGTDLKPEQYFLVTDIYNGFDQFFKTGKLPFYSWNLLFGTNRYAALSFYGNADLYIFLGYLFRGMEFFDRTLVLEILKFYVAGIGIYLLLKEMGFKASTRIVGGLCFTFSGWAIFFSGQSMFLSFYSLIPYYFLAMERYWNKGKWGCFWIVAVVMIFTNWYFFYTLSLLTLIYFPYRYYQRNGSFKRLFPSMGKLVLIDLLAVGTTMIYLLPVVFYLMGNDRVMLVKEVLSFDNWRIYFHLLASSFVPNNLYLYGNNVFETIHHFDREICMYAGSLMVLLLPHSFFLKEKKKAVSNLIFYCILFAMMAIPFCDQALHGFGEASFRWLCFYTIFVIMTGCQVFEQRHEIPTKRLWFVTVLEVLICVGCIPVVCMISKESFSTYMQQENYFAIGALFLLLSTVFLSNQSNQKGALSITICFVELFAWHTYFYQNETTKYPNNTYKNIEAAMHVLQDRPDAFKNYLNHLENENAYEYYRVYCDEDSIYWNFSWDMPVVYKINGLTGYYSTFSPGLNMLRYMDPHTNDENTGWIFNIVNYDVMSFLNTKYAIVTDESQLPKGDWTFVENYRGSLMVYQNNQYRPLGTTYSSSMSYDEFFAQKAPLSVLSDHVLYFPENEQFVNSNLGEAGTPLTSIVYGENSLYGTYQSKEDSFMVLTLPYDKGWKITIDGQKTNYSAVNGGFLGFPVLAGEHTVQMFFVPEGFKTGAVISAISVIILVGYLLLTRKKQKQENHD